jgi:hypothetical protein
VNIAGVVFNHLLKVSGNFGLLLAQSHASAAELLPHQQIYHLNKVSLVDM